MSDQDRLGPYEFDPEELRNMVRDAARDMARCQTVQELRKVWARYLYYLGHRTLGRLLMGQDTNSVASRAVRKVRKRRDAG